MYISFRWNWYTQICVSHAVIVHKVEMYFREFEFDKVEKYSNKRHKRWKAGEGGMWIRALSFVLIKVGAVAL